VTIGGVESQAWSATSSNKVVVALESLPADVSSAYRFGTNSPADNTQKGSRISAGAFC